MKHGKLKHGQLAKNGKMETMENHMLPYGTIWYHMVPYGTIMAPYGTIWYHRVPYGTIVHNLVFLDKWNKRAIEQWKNGTFWNNEKMEH